MDAGAAHFGAPNFAAHSFAGSSFPDPAFPPPAFPDSGFARAVITLCGGINNFHVLEQGSEEEVDAAVTAAMEQLAPGGGFILAPGDTVMYGADPKWEPVAERNVARMIETWKRLRGKYQRRPG